MARLDKKEETLLDSAIVYMSGTQKVLLMMNMMFLESM